jgi:hypothetical protein
MSDWFSRVVEQAHGLRGTCRSMRSICLEGLFSAVRDMCWAKDKLLDQNCSLAFLRVCEFDHITLQLAKGCCNSLGFLL